MMKVRYPKGAEPIGYGESTLFVWHGRMYRFAQGRRGGTIYVAHPCGDKIINRAFRKREWRRQRSQR